jgi:hypothetical protein
MQVESGIGLSCLVPYLIFVQIFVQRLQDFGEN